MSQPKLITKPFADDALPSYVNEIPKENPVGAPEQNASWAVGFPPITMTDLADGGLPPNGEDMNGVLRAITQHNLFIGGGGVYEFTDEYITEVGGYSKGAVLISDDKTALWMSIQDSNTQNFNGATKTQWRRIAFTELDSTLSSIQDALNTKADKSVTITAGTGLSGGGNLSANRTLSVNYGTAAGTAAQGNDSRIVNSVQTSGNQTIAGIKTFSSFPVTPSAAPTANSQAANKKYVDDNAIGVGQIWRSVSRSLNTNYTNSTGRTIALSAKFNGDKGATSQIWEKILVNGLAVSEAVEASMTQAIGDTSHFVIVPPGGVYRFESDSASRTVRVRELS